MTGAFGPSNRYPLVQWRQLGVVGRLEKPTSVLPNIGTDGCDDA